MNQQNLYALNQNYKAVITTLDLKDRDPQYEICVYQWQETQVDQDGRNLWERIAGPFIAETQPQANTLAHEQLGLFAGEKQDQTITQEQVKSWADQLGRDDFQCLEPNHFEIFRLDLSGETHQVKAETLIAIDEVYFLKIQEAWWAGVLAEDRVIHTFRSFDDLSQARQALC